jgi:ferrous iron transport protein B
VATYVPGLFGRFLSEAIIGGVGGVLVFLPQIILLFFMISILEGTGYMSRAALLMDRVMAVFGLEGRAFVAMLSSLACAIPGIMATRSLPSARDRIATMMGAPLMTCSARLPVYTMLIAMLVPPIYYGPVGLQGIVMFGLYFFGALAAMLTAALFGRFAGRTRRQLPFYMELPPYRIPSLRSLLLAIWEPARVFVRKVGSIILLTTAILWVAMTMPIRGDAELAAAGVATGDEVAVVAYNLEHSVAASVGKAVEPVFEPLGFDWRINVGVLASLSAREVFVATMGQIAAAEDPEDPQQALADMRWTAGPREGQPLFTPATTAALLAFFMFALQCFATVGTLRRETGGWRWPTIAFGYMLALAWVAGWLAHAIVGALA